MINTFSAGNHILRKALQVSMHEMAVLAEITALSWNSKTGGWCVKSRAKIADYIDLSLRTVQDIMKTLYYKGYIEYPDDLGVSDARVRCTDLILSIRDSTDIAFIVKDDLGKYVLASTSFFDELRKVNPSFDEDAFRKHLGDGVKKLHPSHFSIQKGDENISQGGVENIQGGAESAYIKNHLNYQINNTLSLDRDSSLVSIEHSDTDACTNNKHNNESVLPSPQAPTIGNARKKNTLASASYARIGNEGELKSQFESFRLEYRKANGSVMGLEKEFENLKKRHPKTWHEIIPILLIKLEDQNKQRKAQLEETKFTPELPMLSRYIKEQMWDRHYYTSTNQSEPKKTIANFTPEQLR